jgi:hypothetical protein
MNKDDRNKGNGFDLLGRGSSGINRWVRDTSKLEMKRGVGVKRGSRL